MKKRILCLCTAACLLCSTVHAMVAIDNVDVKKADLVKNSGDQYTLTVEAQAQDKEKNAVEDGSVLLTVYSDVKGSYDETLEIKDKEYYLYYMDYDNSTAEGKVSYSADLTLSQATFVNNMYAQLTTPNGTVVDISDKVTWPGKAIALKTTLKGKDAASVYTVAFDSITELQVEGTDKYSNKWNETRANWKVTDSKGAAVSGITVDNNRLIIGDYNGNKNLYKETYTVTAEMNGLTDSIKVYVDGNTKTSTQTGGGSSGTGSGSGLKIPPVSNNPTVNQPEQSVFEDVATDFWGYNSIKNLYVKGIVKGDGGKVYPNNNITREEVATLLVNAMGLTGGAPVEDETVSGWARAFVGTAKEHGIFVGDENGVMGGRDNMTREQAALVLKKAFNIPDGQADFIDSDNVSEWARGAVESLYAAGYMRGDDTGMVRARDTITRAEFFTLLDKILG